MKRALVTGGCGFIGSHLVDRLLHDGIDVRILDNLTPDIHNGQVPSYTPPEADVIIGDAADPNLLRRALNDVDVVFHLAGHHGPLPEFSRYFHDNVTSTGLLFELIHGERLPIDRVVVASSQAVQGEGQYLTESGRIVEPPPRSDVRLRAQEWEVEYPRESLSRPVAASSSCSHPFTAYALSKWTEERQAILFGSRYGIPASAVRYSVVQGGRQTPRNMHSGLCRILCAAYLSGVQPTLYEDGRQLRDFINIHDAVNATMTVVTHSDAIGQVVNVSGREPLTTREFDRIVAREVGRSDIEPTLPGSHRFGDARHSVSDSTWLSERGWSPERSAADSVREYLAFLDDYSGLAGILKSAENRLRRQNVIR